MKKVLNQYGAYMAESFMVYRDGQKVRATLNFRGNQNNEPSIYPNSDDLINCFGNCNAHGCHSLGLGRDYYIKQGWAFPES